MDKNETVLLDLDEEQLQHVTGGCEVCEAKDKDSEYRRGKIQELRVKANEALENGNNMEANYYNGLIGTHEKKIEKNSKSKEKKIAEHPELHRL